MWVVEVSTSHRPAHLKIENRLFRAFALFLSPDWPFIVAPYLTCKVAGNVDYDQETKDHVQGPGEGVFW